MALQLARCCDDGRYWFVISARILIQKPNVDWIRSVPAIISVDLAKITETMNYVDSLYASEFTRHVNGTALK